MSQAKQDTRVYNSGTAKLFENQTLERLSRTPIEIPTAFYTVVSLISVFISFKITDIAWYSALIMYLTGMLFFSLIEYSIHRFLFHFHPESEKEVTFQYKMHGVHHEYPKDKERLVMPLFISILLASFFYFLFRFLFGSFHFAFFAGFMQGYCIYLWIHYAVHRYRTPKNIFKFWWHHHSMHHYGRNDTAYAVSMPLWDYLFGTMPRRSERHEGQKTEKYL